MDVHKHYYNTHGFEHMKKERGIPFAKIYRKFSNS